MRSLYFVRLLTDNVLALAREILQLVEC